MIVEPSQTQSGRQGFVRNVGKAIQIVLEPLGFLDGIQVGALDVLDQGGFDDLLIVEVDNPHRPFMKPRRTGRTQPTLPGHQLIAIA